MLRGRNKFSQYIVIGFQKGSPQSFQPAYYRCSLEPYPKSEHRQAQVAVNWYPAEFDYVRHFTSSEQFMMYHKVLMFRKYDLAEQILKTSDPAKCKKIAG